jgi:HAE1 family hydrophobic/amphiphilic exporter-1
MTLSGLALGAGMLIDNAIVVIESIFRIGEQGLDREESIVKGKLKYLVLTLPQH